MIVYTFFLLNPESNNTLVKLIISENMFRLYIRQFQSITWRNNNNQFYSVALNRNNFCTTPVSDEDSKGEKTEPKVGINVSELLETGDSSKKILAAKACDAIISMAQLKRDSSIIEADYKNDARFLNLIKTLESHHVNKVETLSIISSLKVKSKSRITTRTRTRIGFSF